jgi:photosystem II stability/assembly factor-like uncharacterized protein
MSAGTGADSRVYKTEDGGETWALQFQNEDPAAFYDCFAFWTPKHGITFSDAVNGRFPAIRTTDGETWQDIGDQLPTGQAGEAAFAASGTCVTVQGGKRAWIATGGVQGTAVSGGFSVDFRDPFHGILGGGDLDAPDDLSDNVARSSDGGKTWVLATGTPFPGAVFGLSYVRGLGQTTVVATGPGGAAWSPDEATTWVSLPGVLDFWAVAFASPQAGWLVGTEGRILKIGF